MSITTFNEARGHVGHKLECVIYGEQCVSVECLDCCEVIQSWEATCIHNRKESKSQVGKKGKTTYGGRDNGGTNSPENEKKIKNR